MKKEKEGGLTEPPSRPWPMRILSRQSAFYRHKAEKSENPLTVQEENLYNRNTQRRFPSKYIENTLKAIQSTLRSLEIHSNRHCKFLSFRSSSKLLGLQYYFPENFRCNLTYYESEDFSDSSLHHLFQSENVRFPFSTKPNLESEI